MGLSFDKKCAEGLWAASADKILTPRGVMPGGPRGGQGLVKLGLVLPSQLVAMAVDELGNAIDHGRAKQLLPLSSVQCYREAA